MNGNKSSQRKKNMKYKLEDKDATMKVPRSWSSSCRSDPSIDYRLTPTPPNEENTRTLTFSFKVLSLTGVWLPRSWESRKTLKMIYTIFSSITVLATYVFVGLQMTLLACRKFEFDFFADIMFTLPTALSVCFKMMHYLVRRRRVTQLREMLDREWCTPKNCEEREMQRKTNEFIKKFTVGFNLIGQVTLFFHLITPLLQDPSNRKLPFRVWLPYDLRDEWNYWITYGLEIVPMIASILVNVTTDVIVSGFVLQACTQMDFLIHRLDRLPELVKFGLIEGFPTNELQKRTLKQLAVHHDFIIKYAKNVTKTFDVIIVEQYIASVLLFSVIVYQFALGDIPLLQKVMAVGYIFCMTGELFAYCWFGNEITLKSLEFGEEMYKIDWTLLSKESNKMLMFIMLRTSKPIAMSYGDVVVLNIESFKTILKITYSAFSVLKNSSTL